MQKKTHSHTLPFPLFIHTLQVLQFLQTIQTQISKKYGSNANQNEEYDKCSLLTPKRDE
jgi:hypothetical protein